MIYWTQCLHNLIPMFTILSDILWVEFTGKCLLVQAKGRGRGRSGQQDELSYTSDCRDPSPAPGGYGSGMALLSMIPSYSKRKSCSKLSRSPRTGSVVIWQLQLPHSWRRPSLPPPCRGDPALRTSHHITLWKRLTGISILKSHVLLFIVAAAVLFCQV